MAGDHEGQNSLKAANNNFSRRCLRSTAHGEAGYSRPNSPGLQNTIHNAPRGGKLRAQPVFAKDALWGHTEQIKIPCLHAAPAAHDQDIVIGSGGCQAAALDPKRITCSALARIVVKCGSNAANASTDPRGMTIASFRAG